MDILSRAHRILKHLAMYRDLTNDAGFLEGLSSAPSLSDGEKFLGVYVNEPITHSSLVLFSNVGIQVFDSGRWDRVAYSDMERALMPDSKVVVTGFDLLRKNGEKFRVPIAGGSGGKFFDAFEVIRFVNRVLEDQAEGRG